MKSSAPKCYRYVDFEVGAYPYTYNLQIGRFLSVDPMASADGQDMLSPYQAMGNNPVSSVDPGGTRATQIVDQKLIEFNPSPVIYGQVAVNGPPVGYTPEAMEMMGGYTVFTSDWTEGLSNQVSQQVWIDVGDILIDINGGGIAVPGIMSNLTMDAGSGSGGDGFSGGDPPSGDGNGDSKSSSSNTDKPDGSMTLSQANEWAHNGNGEGVYIDFTKIILPQSVTVERFKNYDFKKEGSPGIYVRFDGADFVNPNQALVYGTIRLVLIGKNTVWAIPDEYNFESHNTPGSFWRNMGTIMGGLFSELQYGAGGQPFKEFPIYFMGTQNIPGK